MSEKSNFCKVFLRAVANVKLARPEHHQLQDHYVLHGLPIYGKRHSNEVYFGGVCKTKKSLGTTEHIIIIIIIVLCLLYPSIFYLFLLRAVGGDCANNRQKVKKHPY